MELFRRDHYRLSTGREFYANRGIIGIDEEGIGVSEGCDGGLCFRPMLTEEERHEIASFMAERWAKWAQREDE